MMQNKLLINLFGGRRVFGQGNVDFVKVLRTGLPFHAYSNACEVLEIPDAQLSRLLALSPRTLQRKRKNKAPLDPSASDRLYRMADAYVNAMDLFEDHDKTIEWLYSKNPSLGNVQPIDLLDTTVGVERVNEALNRTRFGVF